MKAVVLHEVFGEGGHQLAVHVQKAAAFGAHHVKVVFAIQLLRDVLILGHAPDVLILPDAPCSASCSR